MAVNNTGLPKAAPCYNKTISSQTGCNIAVDNTGLPKAVPCCNKTISSQTGCNIAGNNTGLPKNSLLLATIKPPLLQ